MIYRSALVALALLLAACGSVPARHYFSLAYPMAPDPASLARPPLHPVRLRIKPFQIALPYNRPQLVYRQSMFEFRYYSFKLWAAKPQHMLRELVERHLMAQRLCAEVSRDYGEELPDYELAAEVAAIEEYDSGDVWYGHLAMRFELVRFRDRMPLWSYHFDRKAKVYEKQPVYVVRALSAIAEEELLRVTAELDAVLSRERGVAPTLVPPPPGEDGLSGGAGRPGMVEGDLVVPLAPGPAAPAPARELPAEDLIEPEDGP